MSSEDESGSGGMSEFDPDGEPDVSPTKSIDGPSTKLGTKRGRPRKNTAPDTPVTPKMSTSNNRTSSKSAGPVPPSPIGGSSTSTAGQAQSPTASVQAPGYLMPTMGPGGIPIMVPAGAPMNANERNHLYTLLRQIPMGFARPDGSTGGLPTGPLPFPFPMHPGLLAPHNISNEPIPSAHDAEAPPGEGSESPSRSYPSSPNKPRPEPGTVEWARQRKDNHKEVERRRRGNINDGINELARMIPPSGGDKAKGAVLQRAVQYLRHLKDNEQKSMEKWTLEKLSMDQVIADWQTRYKECDDQLRAERHRREELEGEVSRLKKLLGETEEDELEEDDDDDERPAKRPRIA